MMNLRAVSRAEYWWQPLQLPRRLWRAVSGQRRRVQTTLTLPWGLPLTIHPGESIGRSVLALNTLDLPVTETLWRLLDAREVAADVGANIGYMTSVMMARLQPGGEVHSFEPMPVLAERLRQHVTAWQALGRANAHVHECAVSNDTAPADLYTPDDWALNHGMATLDATAVDRASVARMRVSCCRLDDVFSTRPAPHVMKVDVEGCELRVFQGAERLLAAGRIRDIVFEELRPLPADSITCLLARGYTVFRIARRLIGPRLTPIDEQLTGEMDPASFLATRDPERARRRFRQRGWKCLA
jgi:FkbM family methyltransferase